MVQRKELQNLYDAHGDVPILQCGARGTDRGDDANPNRRGSYNEINSLLTKNLVTEHTLAAEMYTFQCCRQKLGQSISDFIDELQKYASTCEFNTSSGDLREDRIWNQLVFGMSDERLRSKLLMHLDLSFDSAVQCLSIAEMAVMNSKIISPKEEIKVAKVQKRLDSNSGKLCCRCSSTSHKPDDCRFRNSICHFCKKSDYIIAAVVRRKIQIIF